MQIIYDNINNYNDNEYRTMFNYLNTNDKKTISKLIRINDKKRSILSKYLLKSIISQKYHLDYNNIYFNENNKPFIDGIYFNISHSNDYVVLVFSNKKIGVDIEKIRKVDIYSINIFCTNEEKKYILNSKNSYKSLFEIFCLKEAYFKMLGTNLLNSKNINFIEKNNIIKNNDINLLLNTSIENYIIAIIEKTG